MEKQEYKFCIRCGRRLRTQESKERGMGKICAEKYLAKEERNKLFRSKIDATRNS